MATSETNSPSISELAKAIYEERIRAQVEAAHFGEFLVLNVDSGEYEIDKRFLYAAQRMKAKFPDGRLFGMRIGYRAAYTSLGIQVKR